jgi:pilus assembly protein CpaC
MRALLLCVLLTMSAVCHGQEPGVGQTPPAPAQIQADTSGQRLSQMLRAADELQRAGQPAQAGEVRQQAEAEREALRRHIEFLRAEISRIQKIVEPRAQVLIHLKVMEVSLTKMKQLGLDVTKLQGKPATGPQDAKQAGATTTFAVVDNASEILQTIEKLRKDNLVKVLAEPTLVTISGREATYRSGGELTVPTPQKDGSLKPVCQPYGTEVRILCDVLANRKVRMQVHCRVSELDHASATKVADTTVPGIRAREVSTATETDSGKTLVISGLVQYHTIIEKWGVPFVSDIPYVGTPFTKVTQRSNEIATLVLATPELVDASNSPANPGNAAPAAVIQPTNAGVRR